MRFYMELRPADMELLRDQAMAAYRTTREHAEWLLTQAVRAADKHEQAWMVVPLDVATAGLARQE